MRVSKEQSYKIQLLRGMAIIAVVLIHNTPSGLAQAYVRPILNFAVALFVFISGLLSSIEKWNPWHRIWKVLVPYLIWTMIYTILHNYHFIKDIPLLFLKNLITGKSEAIMYYVFVYCQLTLLIPLIDKLAKSKYKFLGLAISPLEIIIFRLIPKLLNFQFSSFISLLIQLSCIGWFSYFYLGYLLGNKRINRNFKLNRLIFGIGGGYILQVFEGLWYFSMNDMNCGTQLKLSTFLTNILILFLAYNFICSDINVKMNSLYRIGNFSFGIYFVHFAIMKVLKILPFYSQIYFPFNGLIVIIVSYIFVYFGKKVLKEYAKYFAL